MNYFLIIPHKLISQILVEVGSIYKNEPAKFIAYLSVSEEVRLYLFYSQEFYQVV